MISMLVSVIDDDVHFNDDNNDNDNDNDEDVTKKLFFSTGNLKIITLVGIGFFRFGPTRFLVDNDFSSECRRWRFGDCARKLQGCAISRNFYVRKGLEFDLKISYMAFQKIEIGLRYILPYKFLTWPALNAPDKVWRKFFRRPAVLRFVSGLTLSD